jgi:predicted xylose isomerase-like sugar epimerase
VSTRIDIRGTIKRTKTEFGYVNISGLRGQVSSAAKIREIDTRFAVVKSSDTFHHRQGVPTAELKIYS